MQHVLNSIFDVVSKYGTNVRYVDLGASNHMTSHGKWFQDMHDSKRPNYVETSDNTTHPIAYVGNVPLSMQDGEKKYLVDVLHVP